MVHYGRHIIDPETGLCEICQRGAIQSLRHGKRPGRNFLNTKQNGKSTHRSNNGDGIDYDQPSPRPVRRPVAVSVPAGRTRPAPVEQPTGARTRPARRALTPPEDTQRLTQRSNLHYYVDDSGQMYDQYEGAGTEPRRNHVVEGEYPTRRVVQRTHRRAFTPPPRTTQIVIPASNTYPSSDTEVIDRRYRKQPMEYRYDSPQNPEMYSIESGRDQSFQQRYGISALRSYDEALPAYRTAHQEEPRIRQHRLDPLERRVNSNPETSVVRKVYKKLPATDYETEVDDYAPIVHNPRSTRRVEKIYPSPRNYIPSPQLVHSSETFPSEFEPSMYHMRTTNDY